MTFRELFLAYQYRLESKWAYQSNLLAATQNQTVAMIRILTKAKPDIVTPEQCNPYAATQPTHGTKIDAENIEALKAFGDQFCQQCQSN